MEVAPWVSELFILAGLGFLAAALFRSGSARLRRLAIWLIWGTIGMAIWFWTDRWYLVVLGLLAWFAIPVGQATLMSRKLRFSLKRKLTPGPLNAEEFPEIRPISTQLHEIGFSRQADVWLKPSPLEQGFRVFAHQDKAISAAVAVVRQGAVTLSYLIFATRDQRKNIWITWDYPLAYGLKMPPSFQVYRCLEAASVSELFEQHEAFLEVNDVHLQPQATSGDAVSSHLSHDTHHLFDGIFKETMRYNLECGVLAREHEDGEAIRYSWRGTFFIAWQVLVEVVRG